MENTNVLALTSETLELKIDSKKLGELTTNAKDIKAMVEKILPNYDIANYNESNIDSAKKDKALLNSSAKALNDKRIEIEKEWMVPFDEFKSIVAETCKLIKSATDKIDVVVKDSEQKEKDEKKKTIETFWSSKEFTLVSLEKLFDEKWLNKTAKIKDVEKDILSKIDKINDDITTLEALAGDTETLKAMYLENLDINKTIQYANTIKQNKEKLTSSSSTAPVTEIPVVESVSNIEVVEGENPFSETNTEAPASTEASTEPKSDLLVIKMKVKATYDQLVALGDFMNDNGINFEKIVDEPV